MATAPNFYRNYPMGGSMIGPAWQAAWDSLESAKTPVRGRDLVSAMTGTGVVPITAENLLRRARKAGKLRVTYRMVDSRKQAFYSIPKS